MAISSLVAAESSSVNAKVFNPTAAYTTYQIDDTFLAGGYTVTTSPSTAQVQVQFINASSVLANNTTVSGTVSFSIASDATQVYIKDTSGSTGTTVTITYTSVNVSGAALSGTLDTITTTSTYNQTGLLYAYCIGGGGGGGGANTGNGGSGGGSGGVSGVLTYENTSTSITIGSGGNAPASNNFANSGGATSFGNFTVNGGAGGAPGSYGASSERPAGGTPGGVSGGSGNVGGSMSAAATSPLFTSIKSGTTGSGAGGGGGAGGGSGIGTGGSGSDQANKNANGFGAGGGAAAGNTNATGGNGSPGVVYVLRGF